MMRLSGIALFAAVVTLDAFSVQNEPRFTLTEIDSGAAESVTVADINKDGKPDIVSAGSWYEAPRWTKHAIREVPVSSGYVDSFSDLALDVDRDGFTEVV